MILMYHKVYLESLTPWWVDVNNFYRQLCELKCKKIVYLDEYNPKDPSHVVISFDGVYKNILQYAAPLLKKFGYPFELFVIGDFIGKDNSFDRGEPVTDFASRKDLQKLVRLGGRIQWHTRTHANLITIDDQKKLTQEIKPVDSLKLLDRKGMVWFASPHGNTNKQIINLAKKYFKGVVSCIQGDVVERSELNRVMVGNDSSFKKASITVIIPSYNYGQFLVEAVESVLRQTRLADEILISDDCSSDNTEEIARYYQKQYPHLIKFNRNQRNLGIVKHFNKAVKLTKSDYICFLGADNRFRSDYLEKSAEVLDSDDQIAIVYTDCTLFGPRASLLYNSVPQSQKGPIIDDTYYIVKFPDFSPKVAEEMKQRNIMHGSSMYRRKAFIEAGGYKEGAYEDHNLFYRIVAKGWKAKRVALPILQYRQHSTNQANIRVQSVQELNFYKSQYQQIKQQLQSAQEELGKSVQQLKWTEKELQRIQSSKFWKFLFLYKNPREGIRRYGAKIPAKILNKIINIK